MECLAIWNGRGCPVSQCGEGATARVDTDHDRVEPVAGIADLNPSSPRVCPLYSIPECIEPLGKVRWVAAAALLLPGTELSAACLLWGGGSLDALFVAFVPIEESILIEPSSGNATSACEICWLFELDGDMPRPNLLSSPSSSSLLLLPVSFLE